MQRDVKIGIAIGVLLLVLVAVFWWTQRDKGAPVPPERSTATHGEQDLPPPMPPAAPSGGDGSIAYPGTAPATVGDGTTPEAPAPAVPGSPIPSPGGPATAGGVVAPGSAPVAGGAETGPATTPVGPAATPDQTHTVKAGETLEAIAKQYYGDSAKWPLIQRANADKVPDPKKLRIGTTLTIPGADSAIAVPAGASAPGRPPSSAKRTHVVKTGETLSKLSEKYYGTPTRWKRIYDANRDKIKNPDVLPAGVKLDIP